MKTNFTTSRSQATATWRKHRKFLRQALSLDTIKQDYSDLFVAKASGYTQAILDDPDNFLPSLKRRVVRFVPAWFPGAKFRRDAREWGQHSANLRNMMIEGVEERMATKEGRPCYVSNLLEDLQKLSSDTSDDIRDDVQATEVVLKNFLLAMTLYPEIQAHAREEVDRVYGEGPPGDFEGQEKMPYLRAILLECLRWNPPVSAGLLTLIYLVIHAEGLPHVSREDDIYGGYFIPKGTTVIPNLWYAD
ncbi:hypothetical protein FRC05_003370 [Tulasnella sp. 425]|nr:hypothetical protein FRC05_003370 [Tulasnella sp. 425]